MKSQKKNKGNTEKPDPGKKIVFTSILVLLPVLLLVIIEMLLRVFDYGENYELFIETKLFEKNYYTCNPVYGKKYFRKLSQTSPRHEYFLKEKPENGFRIFVMGSSTVYGFPYSPCIMFTRILEERLQDSYPDRHIEVVNTSISAVNSYTLQDIVGDILEKDPDAILIYAGHNEFYGGMGIGSVEKMNDSRTIKLLHLKLLEFKIYQLIRDAITGIENLFTKSHDDSADTNTATLMERIVDNRKIEYKSNIYNRAHSDYRKNMAIVLHKAHRKNIPVFISEVVSNIRDLPPLGSVESENFPSADEAYQEGLAFEQGREFEKARAAFYQAKDLDGIRFRASEELNAIIGELADEYEAHLVPMKRVFEETSENGCIGNSLLLEHVHPNIDGYFLMADAFYSSVTDNQVIGELKPDNCRTAGYYRKNWGYTALDSMYADISIQKLKGGWPFKPDTVVNRFEENYRPETIIDSLAYKAVRYQDITIEAAHTTLAKYYIVHNQPIKAFKEYYANIMIDPLKLSHYIDAGDLLFEMKDYDKALAFYQSALDLDSDIYVLSRLGETSCENKNYKDAIRYLEEVRKTDENFRQITVVNLLYHAYRESGDLKKAGQFYKANENILADKTNSENKKEIFARVPDEVKTYIDQAFLSLKSNQPEQATELLLKANQISETAIANRLLGEIFFRKQKKEALYYLKKGYSEYKSDPQYLNTLCYACVYFKDYNYAGKILPELKQLDPGNPNIETFEKIISRAKKSD